MWHILIRLQVAVLVTFSTGFAKRKNENGLKGGEGIDLNELRERYNLAYTRTSVNDSRMYLSINDQKPSNTKQTCGNLTSMSDKQRNVVANAFGAPSQQWKKAALEIPKARLFYEELYSGTYEDYSLAEADHPAGCNDLKNLSGNVSSVSTFGTCVRLFTGYACDGWSLAIYNGSGFSHHIPKTIMPQANSIGPCLPEEFQSTAYKNEANNSVIKNTSDTINNVFDLVQFGGLRNCVDTVSSANTSVTYRLLGPWSRLEFIQATVRLEHLIVTQTSVSMEKSDIYTSLEPPKGDVVGYAIPLAIGGPANESYNVFPARQELKEKWENLTSSFRSYLERENTSRVIVSLNLLYEDVNQTRPYALYYHIWDDEVSYGRLQNTVPSG